MTLSRHTVILTEIELRPIRKWLFENNISLLDPCNEPTNEPFSYVYNGELRHKYAFAKASDAMLFKLTWGGK